MIWSALLDIRQRLMTDTPLAAYFASTYPGMDPHFFIGLKPDFETGTAVPADLFPYVAVSPDEETKEAANDRDRTLRALINYGVNDDRVENGAALGLQAVCEIGELILQALRAPPLGGDPQVTWDGQAVQRSDAGVMEPYYESVLIITVKTRLSA